MRSSHSLTKQLHAVWPPILRAITGRPYLKQRPGETIYVERLDSGAPMVASLVAADGKIYCTAENGTVHVLAAGTDFNVLSRNTMGEPCLATPAISEGVLYFRTTESLVAIQQEE
jgi:outer membrane protein assembly factor BamB